MKSEDELRERLSQLKKAHSDAITDGLSEKSVIIAEHKIKQLKWILDD